MIGIEVGVEEVEAEEVEVAGLLVDVLTMHVVATNQAGVGVVRGVLREEGEATDVGVRSEAYY